MGKQATAAVPLNYGRQNPPQIWAWWRRRGTVVVLGVAVWLGMVFYYTWPAWAMALYRLIADGGTMLLWLGAAVGLGSVLLRPLGAMEENDKGVLRFVTAAALGLGTMSLLILALGLAGWLNRATTIGLLAAGWGLGIAILVSKRWHPHPQSHWLADRAAWAWLLLLCVPFIAIMTAGSMVQPYLLWSPAEPHGYDVVEYHLQVPREWYEAGRIIPLHHNAFSYFPFNVEMHYLLAMHLRGGPWAGMYLAPLMHGTMILLAVLAASGFARRLARQSPGAPEPLNKRVAPVFAALAMLTTPWLAQLGAICYDEGGFLLFGTLSIGWTVRALRDPERRVPRFILAGLLAGFACGSKLTAVPELLVAIPVVSAIVLLLIRRTKDPAGSARPTFLGGPLAFALAGAIVFSPWLIRTAVWSGNPVFPELPSVFGHGDFSQVQVERWHNAHTAPPQRQTIAGRLRATRTDILGSWQFGFLLVPLALLSIAMNYRDRDIWLLGGLFLFLWLFWTGFTHLQSRFFILAVPICALLIARLPWFVGVAIALQAFVAFPMLNHRFLTFADQFTPQQYEGMIGSENLSWMLPEDADKVPATARLVLVGDAKAFLYQRPMSLLSYRTIFDADTSNGRGILDAWAGPPNPASPQWLLIDPDELKRFARTYRPFPSVPPDIAKEEKPFLSRR